jgi:signal peptidase I
MRHLDPERPKSWRKPVWIVVVLVVIAGVLGATLGRRFLVTVAIVNGTSMVPTFQPGTWVYTAAIDTPLERGDIILLNDGHSEQALKRIVGVPGETVCIHRGYVFINGQVLLEPYIPKRVYTLPRQKVRVFVLGPEEYFVLGDNRPASADSRSYGPIARKQIGRRIPVPEGAVRARFGPLVLPIHKNVLAQQTVSKLDLPGSKF